MCLYPKLIKNPKYRATKKNGGVIPPISDERLTYVPIGCQECFECRKKKMREWQVRMLEDVRHNKNGQFITLTFSDQSIAELAQEIKGLSGYNLDNKIATIAMRRWMERWRWHHKKSLRHWFVTELGHKGTENIHMHGIVWPEKKMQTLEAKKILTEHWQYGHIWVGTYVNESTVNYITKYVNKQDKQHKLYKPIILTSAGIGSGYIKRPEALHNKFANDTTRDYYRTRTGHKVALPIYYRNKLYTEEEREQLWLIKLNQEKRYVGGIEIDVSTEEGLNNYFKAVEFYRTKNTRLGYGNGEIDLERKAYEQECRNIKIKTRIAKGMNKKK